MTCHHGTRDRVFTQVLVTPNCLGFCSDDKTNSGWNGSLFHPTATLR